MPVQINFNPYIDYKYGTGIKHFNYAAKKLHETFDD